MFSYIFRGLVEYLFFVNHHIFVQLLSRLPVLILNCCEHGRDLWSLNSTPTHHNGSFSNSSESPQNIPYLGHRTNCEIPLNVSVKGFSLYTRSRDGPVNGTGYNPKAQTLPAGIGSIAPMTQPGFGSR